MKILVIEDNIELLHDIQNFLEREGNVCEIAESYQTAYMKVGIFPYDILVVDIKLRDGSGLDIIKEVKKENIDVGIIIISAKNTLEDKVYGLEIGADDYLTKPFYLPELNARVNALYRRKIYKGSNEIVFNEIKNKAGEVRGFCTQSAFKADQKKNLTSFTSSWPIKTAYLPKKLSPNTYGAITSKPLILLPLFIPIWLI